MLRQRVQCNYTQSFMPQYSELLEESATHDAERELSVELRQVPQQEGPQAKP